MANDESTDTAFEREDKQVSDGNANCQRDSDVLMINHLRESLAKENADAEKWSWECQRIEKERDEAKASCAESAVEIKRLRHEVVDRIVKCERLTKERDEARAACADELHENLELFALLGLNSKEDFGNDTSTKALRKRIEVLMGERDEARAACAEIRIALRREADAAYVKACEISKREECLGEDAKLKTGNFGAKEMKAHRQLAQCIGFHQMAYRFLDGLPATTGKGWLSPEVKEKLRHAINALGAENHNLECPNCPACRRVEEAIKLLESE